MTKGLKISESFFSISVILRFCLKKVYKEGGHKSNGNNRGAKPSKKKRAFKKALEGGEEA
jgi:hypothetical protein